MKLRLTPFLTWLLANGQVLIKILSNFILPIPLVGKRRGNRGTFNKKASSKAVFLIFLLYNFFEDAFLLLSLHLLIVSSSFCFLTTKLDVGIFGKDNVRTNKEDDPKNTSANADG